MQERFVAGLTPLPTAARVSRQRGVIRWRVITTIISFAIFAVIYFVFGRDWPAWSLGSFIAIYVVSSGFWLVLSAVQLARAKKDLESIQEGVAFYLDPRGIEFVYPSPQQVSWSDITALRLAGHNFGAGPRIVVEARGQEVTSVPLSFLDANAEVIDSAAQAYSLGRIRLDTSALDNIL